MGKIFDVIKKLGEPSAVGHKITTKKAHGEEIREYTIEAYSKRKKTATLSREFHDRKIFLKISLDNKKNQKGGSGDEVSEDEIGYPIAVYTASGKLVHLAV